MIEKRYGLIDEQIIENEFKKALYFLISLLFGLSFITVAVFFIPIGFLSRTARRVGEYVTLFELDKGLAVLIVIIIWLVVLMFFLLKLYSWIY